MHTRKYKLILIFMKAAESMKGIFKAVHLCARTYASTVRVSGADPIRNHFINNGICRQNCLCMALNNLQAGITLPHKIRAVSVLPVAKHTNKVPFSLLSHRQVCCFSLCSFPSPE